jgi:ribonuclease R
MADLENQILAVLGRKGYTPVKPKTLARKLGLPQSDYRAFRHALRQLLTQGRAQLGKGSTVRPVGPHGTVTGIYRKASGGYGFVKPAFDPLTGGTGPDILIREEFALDAASGDEVLVKITKRPKRAEALGPTGEIVQIINRATRQFVGAYFERDGQGFVRVEGDQFERPVLVGDPGAKGARPDDLVVIEMLRFPSAGQRGEAVITEVLGPRGQPGVDTQTVIRAYGLPDEFPPEALEEARRAVEWFQDGDFDGREDFTQTLVITIDPVDARDFDDAVSLTRDPASGHWTLTVHVADVAHFAPAGGPLDREARARATSIYLPQKVIPMFPEIISNGVASLQEGKFRYVKSVVMEFSPAGQLLAARFANGAIRTRKRFSYEQVSAILGVPTAVPPAPLSAPVEPEIVQMLQEMRELAMLLRQRRFARGALELYLPKTELEYDAQGKVCGAHKASHDVSHQIIEEFMLAANVAVAEYLTRHAVSFLRRVHPAPEVEKLRDYADFVGLFGYELRRPQDRFALQRILNESAPRDEGYAVHYALLRSLKQATYSPIQDQHYALAFQHYCHFTSPIRRYPDLTVHRLLDRLIRTGHCSSNHAELVALGEHCSKLERRAEQAERELVKLKLLAYLNERIGLEMDAIIVHVSEMGFVAQGVDIPAEGLVQVNTLADDFYYFHADALTLAGRRLKRTFRLGDRLRVRVVSVDLVKRLANFEVVQVPGERYAHHKKGR